MTHWPKISIVTACFNQKQYIEESIQSVISQAYPNLEYVVIDGGSTDGTVDIIKKYASSLKYWVSEKDNGLYSALQKGFEHCTGEIMGWLNSDDILHRQSLFTLAGVFGASEDVRWIQGYPTVVDKTGRIVFHRQPRSSKDEFYLKKYHDGVFIQQESTYWRRSLWEQSGSFISTEYKYAGDFELWMRFFNHAHLYTTDAMIGAFRIRGKGQLSADNYNAYISECDAVITKCLAALPVAEQSRLTKLASLQRVKDSYPRMARLLGIGKRLMPPASHVYFDFKDDCFKKFGI